MIKKDFTPEEVSACIAELVRLYDDISARICALQSLLQDHGLITAEELQARTDHFREQFAREFARRAVKLLEKHDAEEEIQRVQRILDEYRGPVQ